jgi:hypothetical protein
MLSKKNHPKIEVNDWIIVEGSECLITQIYGGYSVSGACEVVTDPDNPVNRDVCWDGQQWLFSTRPSFINAAKTSRLKEFVATLRQKQGS